jgi:hypothetical protein
MAGVEGAVRMRSAGKFIILGGVVFTVLGATGLFLSWFFLTHRPLIHDPFAPLTMSMCVMLLTYLGILPQIIGGCLWLSGWIAEGFLAPRQPE